VRGLALLPLVLAACADETPLDLALPSLGSARTAIAALLVDGRLVEVRALDLTDTPTLLFDAPRAQVEAGTAALVGYDDTLAGLGLEAGRLTPVADGQPLPAPGLVLTRALDEASAAWAPSATLPPALADARFDAFAPVCPTFRQAPIAFPTPGVRYAVEVAGAQVLIGLETGALMALRPDEQPRPITTSSSISAGIATAVPRADGSVDLIDAFCCVYRATLAGDVLQTGPPECPAPEACGIVVSAVAHDDALTWITFDGKLMRHTRGAGFEPLGRLLEAEGDGKVARDEAGTTFAAQRSSRLAVVDSAGFRFEDVPDVGREITALAVVPGVGLVLGGAAGRVVRRDGPASYSALGETGLGGFVTYLGQYPPDALWIVAGNGGGVVWRRGEACPIQQVGAGVVQFAPRFGRGWLLIGHRTVASEVTVATWVRPVD
jgi:hypothetical protein